MIQFRALNSIRSLTGKQITRNYAAAAGLSMKEALEFEPLKPFLADGELKVSQLPNGINIATIDSGASVSRLAIVTRSGSRHESAENVGITHIAKNAAFNTCNSRSRIRVYRELQSLGTALESTHSRELMSRNAEFLRDNLSSVVENIVADIASPNYVPWEMTETVAETKKQNASVAADDVAAHLEILHNAAYRTGLGNSLYCHHLNLGRFSVDEMQAFHDTAYVGNNITIVATDVDHSELCRLAQDALSTVGAGEATVTEQQTYHGGEARQHTGTGLSLLSLVGESASLLSDEQAVFGVLQSMLGGAEGSLKRGTNTSRLNRAAQSVTQGTPLLVSPLNISYSDSGLFGFHVVAQPSHIAAVARSAVGQLQDISAGNITPEELARAKTQLVAASSMNHEVKANALDDLTRQLVLSGGVKSLEDSLAKVAAVSLDSIKSAAEKILSGKLTLATSGNISNSPFLDELL